MISSFMVLLFMIVPFPDPVGDTAESTVKIFAKDEGGREISASGFRIKEGIITALHVVTSGKEIEVYFPSRKVLRSAKVSKVLSGHDLVLLTPAEEWPDIPQLNISSNSPSADATVFVVGFPLDQRKPDDSKLRIRKLGTRLQDIVAGKISRSLKYAGLDVKAEILNLDGHLLPGHSGAPIVGTNGKLMGIAIGGLEQGAASRSWGVPASAVTKLLESKEGLPSRGRRRARKELFAAETSAAPTGKFARVGDHDEALVYMRTRTLTQLIRTSDDVGGSLQLLRQSGLHPELTEYDVWEHATSGAVVVVPHGVEIEARGTGKWRADLPTGNTLHIEIREFDSIAEVQQRSAEFEREVFANGPGVGWIEQTNWSYLVPIPRVDGVIIRRKAALRTNNWGHDLGGGFETLAVKGTAFLGVAVVRLRPAQQGFQNEVLGVHLTTFAL